MDIVRKAVGRASGAARRRAFPAAFAGAALVLGTTGAWASDPGEVAAALEGTAAECRYVGRLCRSLERRDRELTAARSAVAAEDSTENVGAYRDAFVAAELAAIELAEAANAIRRKHEAVPACFCDCAELVRMAGGAICGSH